MLPELWQAFDDVEDKALNDVQDLFSMVDYDLDELTLIKEHMIAPVVDAAMILAIKRVEKGPPIDMLFFVGDDHKTSVERHFLTGNPHYRFLYSRGNPARRGPLAITRF